MKLAWNKKDFIEYERNANSSHRLIGLFDHNDIDSDPIIEAAKCLKTFYFLENDRYFDEDGNLIDEFIPEVWSIEWCVINAIFYEFQKFDEIANSRISFICDENDPGACTSLTKDELTNVVSMLTKSKDSGHFDIEKLRAFLESTSSNDQASGARSVQLDAPVGRK